MGSAAELAIPFVGAIQAAVSVLLTIFYGVLAAQYNLLSGKAAKEVSNLCVRMFLPALLIYKVGSELQQGTAIRYVPILRKFTTGPSVALYSTYYDQYGQLGTTCSPWPLAVSRRVL